MKKRQLKILRIILIALIISITDIAPISAEAFDEPGDFTVEGNVGIGTETPQQKLDVDGSIRIAKRNWEGIFFGDTNKGLVWRIYGGGTPAINSPSLVVGNDGFISEIYWDTLSDGGWAFCEGIAGDGNAVKCSNYEGLMDNNDYYWVWKHGFPTQSWCTGDCATRRRDLKFVFDGETNDGVMGFMEDEDAFFFDEKVGIGIRTPSGKLHVTEGTQGSVVTTVNFGYMGSKLVAFDGRDDGIGYGYPSANFNRLELNAQPHPNTGLEDIYLSAVGGGNADVIWLRADKVKISNGTLETENTGSDLLVQKWYGSSGTNYGIENYENRLILAELGVRRVLEYDPSGWLQLGGGGVNVGIGTSNTQGYKLYVNGTAFFNGTAQSSDAQFKKNITPINSALDKVLALKGVSYEWKTDEFEDRGFDDGTHFGVVAQDVETVLPEIVKKNSDGYKGVSYTELIPVMIEAVKEQQRIIQDQQKKIEELSAKVQRLESKDMTAGNTIQ